MKTKIFQMFNLPRILAFVGLVLLIFISSRGPLQAQQVTQGYGSDEILERGIIVRLKDGDASKVTALAANEGQFIHGVVVAPNDAPLTLSDDSQKTFVATQGRFEVLVSNQNGEIAAGDMITISATKGIGMRADDNNPYVLGKAITPFNSGTSIAGQTQVNGRTVQYGRVLTELSVGANPLFKSDNPSVPGFLQRTAEAISGKPVNNYRVYLAAFIAVGSVLTSAVILYGGVRSSITAIGRNPLSKLAVGKGLTRVVLTGLIVFLSGLFAVYLLLKL